MGNISRDSGGAACPGTDCHSRVDGAGHLSAGSVRSCTTRTMPTHRAGQRAAAENLWFDEIRDRIRPKKHIIQSAGSRWEYIFTLACFRQLWLKVRLDTKSIFASPDMVSWDKFQRQAKTKNLDKSATSWTIKLSAVLSNKETAISPSWQCLWCRWCIGQALSQKAALGESFPQKDKEIFNFLQ